MRRILKPPRKRGFFYARAAMTPAPDNASKGDTERRPEPPREPALEQCCGTGCNRCVFDIYSEALDRYLTALADWERRQPNG